MPAEVTEAPVEEATETEATPAESTEPTAPEEIPKEPEAAAEPSEDDAEKWKALARKNEARAKENAEKAKQFDEFKSKADTADGLQKELAAERAGRKHGLTDEDVELLRSLPTDQLESVAARLASTPAAKFNAPPADGLGDEGEDIPGGDLSAQEIVNQATSR